MNECLAEGGNPCLDGDCVNLEPDYECLCYAGFRFRGGACVGRFPLSPRAILRRSQTAESNLADVDECADSTSNPCGLGGVCRNDKGGYACECGEGYEFREGTCLDVGTKCPHSPHS